VASRMKLTGVNQLWVADITYIRLHRDFVFLAVILDALTRGTASLNMDRDFCRSLRRSYGSWAVYNG
jgi:putative transposase